MSKLKLLPFNIEKVKEGAQVVTEKGNSVRIVDFNRKTESTYKMVAEVLDDNGNEYPFIYDYLGEPQNDPGPKLFIKGEVKYRKMTNQELSDWLRDAPEEHRELRYAGDKSVYSTYDYIEDEANTPERDVFIRRNHGEWQEPFIEE